MAAWVELEVSSKAGTSKLVLDRTDNALVGRHQDCHIRLVGDGQISRFHFLLSANPPDVFLRDLGSLNGTYVNGMRVRDAGTEDFEVKLHDGDRINVGKASIIIRLVPTCDVCGARLVEKIPMQGDAPAQPHVLCDDCHYRTLAADQIPLKTAAQSPAKVEEPTAELRTTGDLAAYAPDEMIGQGGMGIVYRGLRGRIACLSRSSCCLSGRA